MGSQGHGVTKLPQSECGAGQVKNPMKFKAQAVCKRWLEGRCSYGGRCMFRHDSQDPELPDSEEYWANRYAQRSSMSSRSKAGGADDAVMGDNGSSNSRDGNASRHKATDQKNGSNTLQQTA